MIRLPAVGEIGEMASCRHVHGSVERNSGAAEQWSSRTAVVTLSARVHPIPVLWTTNEIVTLLLDLPSRSQQDRFCIGGGNKVAYFNLLAIVRSFAQHRHPSHRLSALAREQRHRVLRSTPPHAGRFRNIAFAFVARPHHRKETPYPRASLSR